MSSLASASYEAAIQLYNDNLRRKRFALNIYMKIKNERIHSMKRRPELAEAWALVEREAAADLIATAHIANQSLTAVDNASHIIEDVRAMATKKG
jgi:hypothetical protein